MNDPKATHTLSFTVANSIPLFAFTLSLLLEFPCFRITSSWAKVEYPPAFTSVLHLFYLPCKAFLVFSSLPLIFYYFFGQKPFKKLSYLPLMSTD